MSDARIFLIAVVLLAGGLAITSNATIDAQTDSAGLAIEFAQFATPLSGPLCADESLRQGLIFGEPTIFDDLTVHAILCSPSCECVLCVAGQRFCTPVPPPPWCG